MTDRETKLKNEAVNVMDKENIVKDETEYRDDRTQNTEDVPLEGNDKPEGSPGQAPKKDRWWLLPLLAAALAAFLNLVVLLNARIPSGSMEPTIATGSLVLGDRTAYRRGDPQTGDVVFFRHQSEFDDKILVKRVIALPGQTFFMLDGRVYLDGQLLDEPYVAKFSSDDYPPTVVPEGCYLVLGDNRTNSNDARFWANPFLQREELLARAMFVYFPFSEFHTF